MSTAPLTHHEILTLVEPFTRRGHVLDLAASDRAARRLLFKPPASSAPAADAATRGGHAADAAPCAPVLQLEGPPGGPWRLTRTLAHAASGLQSTLQAQGRDLGALLARVEAVPAARQIVAGPGFVILRSYRLDAGAAEPLLTQGEVLAHGLRLTLGVSAVRGVAGAIKLAWADAAVARSAPALPEDLLAVVGWHWTRLVRERQGWTSKLRLRGAATQRTQRAEAALDRAAAHLARTLAEPPAAYHARLRAARWGAFVRRGFPTLMALGLLATLLLGPRLDFDGSPGLWVALYHLPTLLVALSFTLQELPRFEIPPWPRPLRAAHWHEPATPGKSPPANQEGVAHSSFPPRTGSAGPSADGPLGG